MADIYDRSKKLAIRMLSPRKKGGKGLECKLIKITTGDYDPETSSESVTETVYDTSAVRTNYDLKNIDGTNIQANDVLFLVSPVQLNRQDMPVINETDKFIFDSTRYSIISVKPWNYAGLNVGFEIQGRL